jgi:hypothetical protein
LNIGKSIGSSSSASSARSRLDRAFPIEEVMRVPAVGRLEPVGHRELRPAGQRQGRAHREVRRRAPVEDLLDDRVLAVDAVVDRPDPAPAGRGCLLDRLDAGLPLRAPDRRRDVLPDDGPAAPGSPSGST